MSEQLDMFGAPSSGPSSSRGGLELAEVDASIVELAQRMPPELRMGTSSWGFRGWESIVWDRRASQRTLARKGLPVYARHPLLRTVGLDRTYYGAMSAEQMRELGEGLPPDFRLLVKAHAECTTVKFSNRSWYKGRAGQRNELFLEPEHATREVVEPFMAGLGSRGGILLFQFPPQNVPGGPRSFAHRLGEFLAALPKGPQYAVEIRNTELFTPRYIRMLDQVGATHCIAELPGLPDVRKQWEVSGGQDRPALVMRWMLARHHTYETAKETYAPFDRLVDENPEIRRSYAEMIAKAPGASYLIVNNKAEGSSPLSILRMAEQLADML